MNTQGLNDYKKRRNPFKFKILGLWFTNDLASMSELNFKDKLAETKKLFLIWSKRISTPLGRIAILKSLILSKLIYLWILLPNPPTYLIDRLQKDVYNFVWDKKPDKIKRCNAMQDLVDGGIGLPHLATYLDALKIIWARKLVQDSDIKWKHILKTYLPITDRFKDYGGASYLESNCNPFWVDVFSAYERLWDKIIPETVDDFVAEPLFLNNKFTIDGKPIMWSKLFDNNIKQVKDLLDDNHKFMTFQQIETKYDIQIPFIYYFGLIDSIKSYMYKNSFTITEDLNPQYTSSANRTITKTHKGAREFYKHLISKPSQSKALQNWNNLFTSEIPWEKIFKNTKHISEINLKWFQIRINYRILVTNSTLKEMGLKDNNFCSFCHKEKDTIKHYLWDCPLTQIFWQQFENLLKDNCMNCTRLQLNPILTLFGRDNNTETDEGFDFIMLHAKHYIYKNHIKEQLPTIIGFIEYIKHVYKVDKYIYTMNMKQNKFVKKWASYEAIMN